MSSDDSALMLEVQPARHPLTSVAYFDAGTKTGDYVVSVHVDMLKIKHPQSPKMTRLQRTGGIRSTVKGLSRSSRKRMIEFMSSVRNEGSMLFVTLTYPDIFPLESATWHRHFEAFRERFERHYANWRALWRIEVIDRKSGENTGAIAPHWHLIVFLPEKLDAEALAITASLAQTEIRQHWYEIVNSGDENHLMHGADVAPVKSRKHAYHYVSKYVAKESGDVLEIGRRWGRIGEFDTSYSSVALLTFDEFVAFKRIVKRWMKSRNAKFRKRFARQSPLKGCTVFGMGDEAETNWFAFVYEAFRQVAETRFRERSFGT